MSTIEVDKPRRHRNRAVAALTAIDSALFESALIVDGMAAGGTLRRGSNLALRYADMSAYVQDHLKPDSHYEAREVLRALQTVPVLSDEFALMDDATLRCICAFFGERSKEMALMGSLCRRLRNIVIALTPPLAVIVPDMIPLTALSSHTIVDSLCAFFATYKRGQLVRQLRLVDSKYASLLSVATPLPVCSPHLFPSLVRSMPLLTFLDMRGVMWDCHSNPSLPQYFFSDLHLVAPRLQTLKMGVELFLQWSPGWWQRLAALEYIVVGSRRDQAAKIGSSQRPALSLHEDFFDMLRAPRRPWRLKLWCPLQRDGLVHLLIPEQVFSELQELTLNVLNTDIFEEVKGPPTKMSRESKSHKGSKKASAHSVEETDGRVLFPSLHTLSLANVEECPMMLTELLQLMSVRAPRLKNFSVVNTTRVPPLPATLSLRSKKT